MGLSAGAIYVSEAGVGKDLAERLGLIKPGSAPVKHAEKGFDVEDGLRIGAADGSWSCILGSPHALLPRMEHLSNDLTGQSHGRKILFWFTQSTSGGVVFEIHENGTLLRKWVEAEGKVFEDIGDAVPEEGGLVDRDTHEGGPLHSEWTVLELAARMTGISVDEHFDMDGPVYAAAP
ncbi:hypothetical protein [Ramlibacter sp. WS9]|uniref:hypothetical protein n=1 Tax=Ramlibacter sp. WS9 TaxID=1882741 RepID=UPI0011421153|nr:hypothetical protein [Ramlibacter sp. WS9]